MVCFKKITDCSGAASCQWKISFVSSQKNYLNRMTRKKQNYYGLLQSTSIIKTDLNGNSVR